MIETKMPKDIRVYKTKVIGPFTFRQGICLFLAFVVNLIVYTTIMAPLKMPLEFIVYGFVLISIPFMAFGWIEPYGMPLEKYIKNVFLRILACPTNRKVKIRVVQKNSYANAILDDESDNEANSKKKRKKRNKKNKSSKPTQKGFM